MPRIHEALSGHRIEYPDPEPNVEKFLKRVRAIVEDPKGKTDDVIALVFGLENPVLEQSMFPERGAVTKEVLDNPVYHVLSDLVARQYLKASRQPVEVLAKPYTLTVAEAAERKGVTPDAIRKAIRARRLPSWVKEGETYLNPRTLDLVEFGSRGPVDAKTEALHARVGCTREAQFMIRHRKGIFPDGGTVPYSVEGDIKHWRRVAVLSGGHDRIRMLVLEPSDEPFRFDFEGFFVEGKFTIVEKINSSAAARKAWEGFKAS